MRAGCLLRSNVWHAPPRRTPTVCRLFLGCRCPCRCLLRLALCCHEIWNKQMHGAEKVAKRKQKKARKPKEKQKQRRKTRIWNMRKIKLLTKIIYVMVCSTHTHSMRVRVCATVCVSRCACECVGLSCCLLRWLLGHFSLARMLQKFMRHFELRLCSTF